MNINWVIIGIVVFLGLALIIFLIRSNNIDKKKLLKFYKKENAINDKKDLDKEDVY